MTQFLNYQTKLSNYSLPNQPSFYTRLFKIDLMGNGHISWSGILGKCKNRKKDSCFFLKFYVKVSLESVKPFQFVWNCTEHENNQTLLQIQFSLLSFGNVYTGKNKWKLCFPPSWLCWKPNNIEPVSEQSPSQFVKTLKRWQSWIKQHTAHGSSKYCLERETFQWPCHHFQSRSDSRVSVVRPSVSPFVCDAF